jgi:hypothetical protein
MAEILGDDGCGVRSGRSLPSRPPDPVSRPNPWAKTIGRDAGSALQEKCSCTLSVVVPAVDRLRWLLVLMYLAARRIPEKVYSFGFPWFRVRDSGISPQLFDDEE